MWGLDYYGCFAHFLNLIVTSTISTFDLEKVNIAGLQATQKIQALRDLMSQGRKLVGSFNHSTQLTEEFLAAQNVIKENNGKNIQGKVEVRML